MEILKNTPVAKDFHHVMNPLNIFFHNTSHFVHPASPKIPFNLIVIYVVLIKYRLPLKKKKKDNEDFFNIFYRMGFYNSYLLKKKIKKKKNL